MYDHKVFLSKLSKRLYEFLRLENKVMEEGLNIIPSIANEFPDINSIKSEVKGKVIYLSILINNKYMKSIVMKITDYNPKSGLLGDGFYYDYGSKPDSYSLNNSLSIDFNKFRGLGGEIKSVKIIPESEFIKKIRILLNNSNTIL